MLTGQVSRTAIPAKWDQKFSIQTSPLAAAKVKRTGHMKPIHPRLGSLFPEFALLALLHTSSKYATMRKPGNQRETSGKVATVRHDQRIITIGRPFAGEAPAGAAMSLLCDADIRAATLIIRLLHFS